MPGADSPAAASPTITRSPPASRKFPCKKCGARLDFDPSSRALQCPFCGYTERIEPAAKLAQEISWDDYWKNCHTEEATIEGRSSQVTCGGCGAIVLLEDTVATEKCPYCGMFLENKPESAKTLIPPGGLLPFQINENQARANFAAWIAGRWFAPNALRQFANLGQLTGVYAPFWTYDSMTCTHYTGQRGDDYQETETYTETNAQGQTEAKTRTVTRTSWTPVSGEVRHFFDDVLVYAARSLPEKHVYQLPPWDLPHVEDFRADFLSGFHTERYTIHLREGFDRARAIMDVEIRRLCCQQIGGDHQQLNSVDTQHVGVTFKHILLPMWVGGYRYQEKPHHVLVNGCTGKVVGSRPFSWVKITLLILVLLAIVAIVAWLASQSSRSSNMPRFGVIPGGAATVVAAHPAAFSPWTHNRTAFHGRRR